MKRRSMKRVPMYEVKDLKKGRKAKTVGWMSNPDRPGCVMVDHETLLLLCKSSARHAKPL